VVPIDGDDLAAQAASLSRRVPVDWRLAPMTRCLVCNTPLRPAGAAEAAGAPPSVRERGWPVRICETCGRLFWEGSHEARIQRTLAHWAERFADDFARR
jgi:uncharacterized protein with PIN domain